MQIDLAFIVDDDDVYTSNLSYFIELSKFCKRLMVFHDGEEVIEYLKSVADDPNEFPEVILLDISMPIMDGWEFLDRFMEIPRPASKDVVIYVVSSSIDHRDIERAKQYSIVSDYIVKPMSVELLKSMIEDVFRRN